MDPVLLANTSSSSREDEVSPSRSDGPPELSPAPDPSASPLSVLPVSVAADLNDWWDCHHPLGTISPLP